ncbi:MAG: non-homologous end-joining DNA ligase [Halanaerobiales bacterium]
MNTLIVENEKVRLSNLDKILWPKYSYCKSDLINYYIEVYPFLKEFLKNRPLSLRIYPDGIREKSFFQKNVPAHAPGWLSTSSIYSSRRQETSRWIMVNKLSDLIWIANSASIELHAWFSTFDHPNSPDFAVFDLDPSPGSRFEQLIELALTIKEILNSLDIHSYLKTSGKKGLHIYIPLKNRYSYQDVKIFLKAIADTIIAQEPKLATTEWRKKERGDKIYIDYRQNARGKTLACPYSLRPTEDATISTPLDWEELNQDLKPDAFNLSNIKNRLKTKGDFWADIMQEKQNLPHFLFN